MKQRTEEPHEPKEGPGIYALLPDGTRRLLIGPTADDASGDPAFYSLSDRPGISSFAEPGTETEEQSFENSGYTLTISSGGENGAETIDDQQEGTPMA